MIDEKRIAAELKLHPWHITSTGKGDLRGVCLGCFGDGRVPRFNTWSDYTAHLAAVIARLIDRETAPAQKGYPCAEDDPVAHFDGISDTGEGYWHAGRRYVIQCRWCDKVFTGQDKTEALAEYRNHENELREVLMTEPNP